MKITKIHTNEADLLTPPEKPIKAKPQPQPEVIDLYIAKACPNPRWVIGDLDGFRVNVSCPPKLSKSLVRKTVKVRVTKNGDETLYTYER